MSFQAMTWAYRQHVGSQAAKWVLVALANYANAEAAECFPGVKRLAEETELSERAVRNALSTLEQAGYLTRTRRQREDGSRSTDLVVLCISNQAAPPAASQESKRHLVPNQAAPPAGHEPITEPVTSPSLRSGETRAREPTPRDELSKVLDAEHAEAVIRHRQRIGKALTPYAAKLLAGKFFKCRHPDEAADAMVSNGWQGFEPEWLDNRRGHRSSPRKTASDVLNDLADKMDQADDHTDRTNPRLVTDARGVSSDRG